MMSLSVVARFFLVFVLFCGGCARATPEPRVRAGTRGVANAGSPDEAVPTPAVPPATAPAGIDAATVAEAIREHDARVSSLRYTEIRANGEIPDERFVLTFPRGTRVVEMNPAGGAPQMRTVGAAETWPAEAGDGKAPE